MRKREKREKSAERECVCLRRRLELVELTEVEKDRYRNKRSLLEKDRRRER